MPADKSKCLCMKSKYNIMCGTLMKGKNPTNLCGHLDRFHITKYKDVLAKGKKGHDTESTSRVTLTVVTARKYISQNLKDLHLTRNENFMHNRCYFYYF